MRGGSREAVADYSAFEGRVLRALDEGREADALAVFLTDAQGFLDSHAAGIRTMLRMLGAADTEDVEDRGAALQPSAPQPAGLDRSALDRSALDRSVRALLRGRLGAARTGLAEVLRAPGDALSGRDRAEGLGALAFVHHLLGNPRRANRFAEEALRVAACSGASKHPCVTAATVSLALLAADRGDAERAEGYSASAVAGSGETVWSPLAWYARAASAESGGLYARGVNDVDNMYRAAADRPGAALLLPLAHDISSALLFQLGELDEAALLLDGLAPCEAHVVCPARRTAALRLLASDAEGALAALTACRRLGVAHSKRTLVDVLAATAAAEYGRGNSAGSGVAFDRAVILAEAGSMLSAFRLVPRSVLRRLTTAAAQRQQPPGSAAFLRDLSARESPAGCELEPLSRRELEIARRAVAGETLTRIAADLFLSPHTVKTHLRSVYRKLSTSSRVETRARLRQLGLLVGTVRSA